MVDQYRPGEAVAYLSALERGGADAAPKSCWFRIRAHKSNCFNGNLNGLLGPDGEGNLAPWWVYRAYAAAVKHRVGSDKQRLTPVFINMLHLDTALQIRPRATVRV